MAGKYFYVVMPSDIYYEGGDPLPDTGSILSFVEDPEHAHAQLFRRGFNIPFEDEVFVDDGARFKHKEYKTEQDGLSNLLSALTDNVNPYANMKVFAGMDVSKMRFDTLSIHRYVEPSMEGGKRRKRVTRRTKKARKASRKA